jgi:ankyrin repeat protein
MISPTGWRVGLASGRIAVQSAALAIVVGMLWLSPVPAEEKRKANDAGLSNLSIWQGPTFGTGTADFSSGMDEGLKSLGDAFKKAFTPQVGDRFALTPAFREDVGSYSVTIGYSVTKISVAASARDPGALVTVTGQGPNGASLKTGTSFSGVDLDLGGTRLRADTLRSFVDLSVGENAIAVEVAGADASAKRTYTVTVVRLDADLDDAEERSRYFREALVNGSADGLVRAIEAGADAGAVFDFGKQRASAIVFAAAKEFEAAVEILVRAGANVNDLLHGPGTDAHGASSLFLAAAGGHEGIVRLLLEAGAYPDLAVPGPEVQKSNRLAGATPLFVAIYRGHDPVARRLIDARADVNRSLPDSIPGSATNLSGSSVLMMAAFLGKKALVRGLIDAGADVNYRVSGDGQSGGTNPQTAGLTALKLASGRGHTEIAEMLKEAGASR